ncbi:NAD(P)/FAD-dependent oxidoreductase (plasmid) [Nocardioides sp. R1-1]|uniref:NAD(P)/FAD-dependent oxidoreductase n=1 Tax=Nocardioides sp. R1-1 TaxID=3383502 RepID=UPI0038CF58DC
MVIVGAGQAGGDLAADLRELGYGGAITLIGKETAYPYSRHPLSKAFLLGQRAEDDLVTRAEETYRRFDVDVRLGVEVESIDRRSKMVALADGDHLTYDTLVLATGGSPRQLPQGTLETSPNVLSLRSVAHAKQLRVMLRPGQRLTVIGGGYIGLEVASAARALGLEVAIVEQEERLLSRVTSQVTSSYFARLHCEKGVALHLGRSVTSSKHNGSGELAALVLDDGTVVETDVCLIGIGIEPNVALAEDAGLEVADGVIVDSWFRTNDQAIFAIGDVARFPSSSGRSTHRLESIPNSSAHARALAHTLVGESHPYDAVPWFWSDQYDVKFQAVGLIRPDDTVVVRGDAQGGRGHSVFYLRQGTVHAAEVFSCPRDFAIAKKLVAQRVTVDQSNLADEATPLRALLGQ